MCACIYKGERKINKTRLYLRDNGDRILFNWYAFAWQKQPVCLSEIFSFSFYFLLAIIKLHHCNALIEFGEVKAHFEIPPRKRLFFCDLIEGTLEKLNVLSWVFFKFLSSSHSSSLRYICLINSVVLHSVVFQSFFFANNNKNPFYSLHVCKFSLTAVLYFSNSLYWSCLDLL